MIVLKLYGVNNTRRYTAIFMFKISFFQNVILQISFMTGYKSINIINNSVFGGLLAALQLFICWRWRYDCCSRGI